MFIYLFIPLIGPNTLKHDIVICSMHPQKQRPRALQESSVDWPPCPGAFARDMCVILAVSHLDLASII